MGDTRVDTASRFVPAPPAAVYRALLDPEALVSWLPPRNMTGQMADFDPREGGGYRMVLTYRDAEGAASRAKSSDDTDVVEVRFRRLVPHELVVEEVVFVSDDPAFAGVMTMSWRLAAAGGGTQVTISAEDVPAGIRPEDHETGMRSSLDNLAAFVE